MSKERSSQKTMKRCVARAQVGEAGGQRRRCPRGGSRPASGRGLPALPSPSSWRTSACAALTSEDLPMPRAPHSSALLAGRPWAKRRVLSRSWSEARSMPLSRPSGWRLTCGTGRKACGLGLPHEGFGGGEIEGRRRPAAPCARGPQRGGRGGQNGLFVGHYESLHRHRGWRKATPGRVL